MMNHVLKPRIYKLILTILKVISKQQSSLPSLGQLQPNVMQLRRGPASQMQVVVAVKHSYSLYGLQYE